MTDPTEEIFLRDVAKHEMQVMLDAGVHRHLRFRAPNTGIGWFDIVTWPGSLAYTGDMGTFVFRRLEDMLCFFRSGRRPDGKLDINRGYWGEKLQAVDRAGRHSGHREYSELRLREQIEESVSEWIGDYQLTDAEAAGLRRAVQDDVLNRVDDGETEARRALRDFAYSVDARKFEFSDSWEWDCDDYTYRFTWCCYALAWAVRKYDEAKLNATHEAAEAEKGTA